MNVVLLAIDAMRADRLGCYGCPRPTTPFLDTLAAGGVVFENHFTPVVPTQPAFTTIYSGTHPLTHRVVCHAGPEQPNPRIPWLPLLLRAGGVTTVAVDTLYDHRSYFARGFEYYINPRRKSEFPGCDVFNAKAFEWLRGSRHEPFFLAMHYWDPHTPYVPQVEALRLFYDGDPTTTNVGSLDAFYSRPQVERWPGGWLDRILEIWPQRQGRRVEDVNFVRALYEAEVRQADAGVRRFCETLEHLGLLEDTLLIVTADHGEALGEHDIWFDHHGLYENNLHVPLILHWPRGLPTARRVANMSQHQDLAATILDAAGLPVPDLVEGRSLLSAARGDQTRCHWGHELMACECTWQKKWAMRTAEYKLIVSREPDWHDAPPVEVYDLVEDPNEHTNLAGAQAALTRKLLEQFDARLKAMIEARRLPADPLEMHHVTLGRNMWKRTGRAYPPVPQDGWTRHPPPKVAAPKAPARPRAAAAAAKPSGQADGKS